MFGRVGQANTRKTLKSGISAEDSRKKREETSNEIRKSKREESLLKRRNFGGVVEESKTLEDNVSVDRLPEAVQAVHSHDLSAQLEATIHIRRLLSIERNPPIDQVIRTGVIPRLVQFLMNHEHQKLQFEAAWCLTNIASGSSEQTAVLIQAGAVPVFVQLLMSPDEELREQAVWALGNIAGDSAKCRDLILNAGAVSPILGILEQSRKTTMLRNATWTLSNLCRGRPSPQLQMVAPSLPILAKLIWSSDQEVTIDALWALSYISDGTDNNIQAVLDAGVLTRVIALLGHSSYQVQTPALRIVGNIVTGNDAQTQLALDNNVLANFGSLLQSQRKAIRKETCWAISNITAGNKAQTQLVINNNLIPSIINLLSTGEFDVRKEAAWALSNATTWKSNEQIRYMVGVGVIKPFIDCLTSKDTKMIGVILEALDNILYTGDTHSKSGQNPYVSLVEEAEGIDRLEALQDHENEDIYKKAVKILETYFGVEAEEDENITPNVAANGQSFSFGMNNSQVPTGGFAF